MQWTDKANYGSKTKDFVFGTEHQDILIFEEPSYLESSLGEKFVSGLSSISKDSILKPLVKVQPYHYFKGTKGIEVTLGREDFYIKVEETYDSYKPTIKINPQLKIDYDTESIEFSYKVYDYKDRVILNQHYTLDLRADMCNESDRVTSGSGYLPSVFGLPYDSTEILYNNDELQKLNKVGALREETHFGREYNDNYKDLVNLVVDTTNIVNTILKNLRNGTTSKSCGIPFPYRRFNAIKTRSSSGSPLSICRIRNPP